MKSIRIILLTICLLICFLFSGCTLTINSDSSLIVPPMGTGDERAIQSALRNYIGDTYGAEKANQYKLKYPTEGEFSTSFIFGDINGDTKRNEAIVFYALANEQNKIHLNYLRKIDSDWVSISDWGSEYSAVREVVFRDMDGDGTQELLVGWTMSATHESHLCLFKMSQLTMTEIGSYLYTDLRFEKMRSEEAEDLLLFRIGGSDNVSSVRLISVIDNQAEEVGTVHIDGYIKSISNFKGISVDGNKKGIWFDGSKEDSDVISELIYWNGEKLINPFYDDTTNMTTLTARSSGLASADVDADGNMEWARSEKIPRNDLMDTPDDQVWLTEWCSWDYASDTVQSKFYAVAVPEGQYMFRVDEDWLSSVTAYYTPATKTFVLCDKDKRGNTEVMVKICPEEIAEEETSGAIDSAVVDRKNGSYHVYLNTLAEHKIDENEILYRFIDL